MSRLDSLRGKIPRRPSRPDNASGQGRRRTKRQADPAVAAAGRALSDAREVFGDVPRDADADHLVRRARRLAAERTANTTTPPPTNSHPTTDTDPPPF